MGPASDSATNIAGRPSTYTADEAANELPDSRHVGSHTNGPTAVDVCRVIKVPVGTCISPALDRNAEQSIAENIEGPLGSFDTDEAADEQLCSRKAHDRTIADLDAPAARVLVARGGLGGRGSVSKSSADDEMRYACNTLRAL